MSQAPLTVPQATTVRARYAETGKMGVASGRPCKLPDPVRALFR